LFQQPIYHIITLSILVRTRHVHVLAVKSNYNGKNTVAAG